MTRIPTAHADCQVYYCPRCKDTFSPSELGVTFEQIRPPCPTCLEGLAEGESIHTVRMDSAVEHIEHHKLVQEIA